MAAKSPDALDALRAAISKNLEVKLVSSDGEVLANDDFSKADKLQIPVAGSEPIAFPLNELTRYESKVPSKMQLELKVVYNCWLTRDLKVTDYIEVSDERGIFNLKFVERADLLSWLRGDSSTSDNIIDEKKSVTFSESADKPASADGPIEKAPVNPELEKIYAKERAVQDHNSVLHGTKTIDFSMVAKECQKTIIQAFKQSQHQNVRRNRNGEVVGAVTKSSSSTRPKEPIILLSPSASALLNMTNVKQFLEEAQFNPQLKSTGTANLQRITRNSPRLGRFTFVVVDNVERFTRPEYWDRVVAVFATGQAWQFKQYHWSDPNVLFQKVAGFCLTYLGDPVPPQVQQWNVDMVPIDRNQRFRDREVSEMIWGKIEKWMLAKGWTPRHR